MRVPFDEIPRHVCARALAATGMEADARRPVGAALRRGVARRRVVARPEPVSAVHADDPAGRRGRPRAAGAGRRARRARAVGRPRRARQPERARGDGAGDRARPRRTASAAWRSRNTNHWMRGGSYGWQAADAGVIGICWTNTLANLPPWGAADPRIGNNPLIIAVPRAGRPRRARHGDVAVLGRRAGVVSVARRAAAGRRAATTRPARSRRDPAAIEASRRPAARSASGRDRACRSMLDLVAALLSGGQATHEIPQEPELRNRPVAGVHRDRSRPRSGRIGTRRGRRRPCAPARGGRRRPRPRGSGCSRRGGPVFGTGCRWTRPSGRR